MMAMALGALAVVSWWYVRNQEKAAEEDENKVQVDRPVKGSFNMDRERTDNWFNRQLAWERNMNAGNWPFSFPHARPPTGNPYVVKAPPLLAGTIDWSHESNQWLRSDEFKQLYQDNYRNAYSTELAGAIQGQLVDGFWHELITKGDLEIRSKLDLSNWK